MNGRFLYLLLKLKRWCIIRSKANLKEILLSRLLAEKFCDFLSDFIALRKNKIMASFQLN